MMTVRQYTGLDGRTADDTTERCQSLAHDDDVVDDDTGSLLLTSSSLRQHTDNDTTKKNNITELCFSLSRVFVEQRLRPIAFIVVLLLPSLAIVVAFSHWTYTSIQVTLRCPICVIILSLTFV